MADADAAPPPAPAPGAGVEGSAADADASADDASRGRAVRIADAVIVSGSSGEAGLEGIWVGESPPLPPPPAPRGVGEGEGDCEGTSGYSIAFRAPCGVSRGF